jgi:CRP/FNR family transcriptional regulator
MSQEISDEENMMLVLAKTSAEEKLGNYLGFAVETVSRTLTKLQKCGVIKVEGKEVTIVDMEGLSCLNGTNQEQSKALHLS